MEMKKIEVVIDTNVFITSLKSKNGASFKLLFEVSKEQFELNISSALIFEYEDVAKRKSTKLALSNSQIDSILDMICKSSNKCQIFYLWRPFLKDPKDDFILELAIESQSEFIITYNVNDFKGVDKFGIKVATPKDFLKMIGEI